MPELPEVEVFRRYIDRTSLGQRIRGIDVRSKVVIRGTPEEELRAALVGAELEATGRHGKYLFVRLSTGRWLTWHFGMTGEPVYFHDPSEEPKYVRFLLIFPHAYLAFDDPRMLGRIGIARSMDAYIKERRLGPDALSVSEGEFMSILGRSRGAVKSALMDQHKIAGLGNIYSDEVLFQARIDPRSDCQRLSEDDLRSLYAHMRGVLRTSIRHKTDFSKFPSTYLLHDRRRGAPCPLCSGTVATLTMGGRTTYYCPACQRKR